MGYTPTPGLPSGLSDRYWSTWSPSRRGASVINSLERDLGEEWIGSWNDVGLYEGNNKIPSYQSLSVNLTTHRIILIPDTTDSYSSSSSTAGPSKIAPIPSLQTHLSNVRQTEFYTGFMRSSPKITLFLGATPPSLLSNGSSSTSKLSVGSTSNGNGNGTGPSDSSSSSTFGVGANANTAETGWTCRVCGYVNSTSSSNGATSLSRASLKCGLCGIPYTSQIQSQTSNPPSRTLTPLPNSTLTTTMTSDASSSPSTSQVDDKMVACPACTFFNSRFLRNCEICTTPLPVSKYNSTTTAQKQSPIITNGGGSFGSTTTAVGSATTEGKMDIVRLSFRRGGSQEVYKRLKAVLGDKAWERERDGGRTAGAGGSGSGEGGLGSVRSVAGIDGILQSMDLSAKAQDEHMQSAFADLEALMLRAGEMVRLAQSINNKLTQQQASASASGGGPSEEEATMIRTSLVQLGLAAPALTKEMVRDEKRYREGLARELGGLLTGHRDRGGGNEGLMVGKKGRGVIGLDEVWGLWMRARGVALLAPSVLIEILPFLPSHTSPSIQSLTLPSSLRVLHTPTYSTPVILYRTIDRLSPSPSSLNFDIGSDEEKSFSIFEFASIESLPIGLAQEFLEMMEKYTADNDGGSAGSGRGLVRDDQASQAEGGTRWYRDVISSWPLSIRG
ncbi:hypothetical protein CI109_101803 [Kwoniella shandongensis]|uniref:Vacuolar protein-sorting-associated protein 36 n=1 Tax=Kwoniella shandongensis TaxID=1734106 RepID=A0A5M6CA31_9TREE|nr:uncharacterized protein CI109_001075 [Kwoniella shandongensis]KAA5530275.1 hypothetical protein CI109_001075 [Kwoniella shandongensis]